MTVEYTDLSHSTTYNNKRVIMATPHMDFIGQRADKERVSPAGEGDDNVIVGRGFPKSVEHYTMTCNECGGVGYYDQIGEVICDGCGMVLSGDRQPMIQTEYGDDGAVARGRGVEKMNKIQYGHEPSI